jgi:hypothetical protein
MNAVSPLTLTRLAALAGLFVVGAFSGCVASSESAPASSANVEVPIVSMDESVQNELVTLDRLLETNPKLEETLRTNVDQLTEQTFRAQNPEVDALLKRRPGLVRALRTERHYFVHRAVARLARSRVTRNDAIALDQFLTANPDIAKALQRRPSQIIEGDFLIAHPALANFFEAHPGLSSVLLQRSEKAKQGGAKSGERKK